ncbi:hypothetical protein [Burkholderia gladioli]|uniref:hypothetical protein n=1 Tax=Burkholderia gladioli TaxID=28095 RepID=UPI001FC8422A|nr:hypothetical protein [Burkholderia gladioli]
MAPPTVSYEDMKAFVDSGEYRIDVTTTRHVATELELLPVVYNLLHERRWEFVLQTVWRPEPALGINAGGTDAARLAETRARERDAFRLLLDYATGLRRAELAAATIGQLSR